MSRISEVISNEINELHRLSTFDAEESLRMPINFFGFGGQRNVAGFDLPVLPFPPSKCVGRTAFTDREN
jgi:hypothetical protein